MSDAKLTMSCLVWDNLERVMDVRGEMVMLSLWDSAGSDHFAKLRPLSYFDTDVFLILYSVDIRRSFLHVEEKWLPEVRQADPRVPIVLGAMKTDLRDDARFVWICLIHCLRAFF